MWQVTCHMWNVTWDTWQMTHICGVNIFSKFQLPCLISLGIMIFWRFEEKDCWQTGLINYKAFFIRWHIFNPGCERNLHIWFVQKNYISTFLGTFYKICQYSPACKFSVLKGSLHIFVLIFLVRHWGSYLFRR